MPKNCPLPSAFSAGKHIETNCPGNSSAHLLSDSHPDFSKDLLVKDLVVQCTHVAEQITAEDLEEAPSSRPPPDDAVSLGFVDTGIVVCSQVGGYPIKAFGEILIGRIDPGSEPGDALMDSEVSLSPGVLVDDSLQVDHQRAVFHKERQQVSFVEAFRRGLVTTGVGRLGDGAAPLSIRPITNADRRDALGIITCSKEHLEVSLPVPPSSQVFLKLLMVRAPVPKLTLDFRLSQLLVSLSLLRLLPLVTWLLNRASLSLIGNVLIRPYPGSAVASSLISEDLPAATHSSRSDIVQIKACYLLQIWNLASSSFL
ncbi:hypothetical protein Nepgr_017984 [Nepenthes gracilis]|uniref:Uncharacterized protein n=1 Tax=Nepenthes gracilis TaxID=150966 RepID=A0AAD3SQG0_NEPGR|nr:hypothetical protein Nepgr_017984 [Nepenthes gracilis]